MHELEEESGAFMVIMVARIDNAIATLQKAISNLEKSSSLKLLATVNLLKAYTQQRKLESILGIHLQF